MRFTSIFLILLPRRPEAPFSLPDAQSLTLNSGCPIKRVRRQWLTPFCDAAELIGKAAAVLKIYSTSQDIIISSFMAPLLANLYAIERLDRIEHAIQEQNANLWNDSAFQDALANSKNFLNESKSKQFLSILLDELTDIDNAVDLINGAKTLAGVQFSKHVIGLICGPFESKSRLRLKYAGPSSRVDRSRVPDTTCRCF